MENNRQDISIRPESTEAKLIDAGIALFGELGFKATTTRMIADQAGANIGSIAYYFGNKQGLYLAIAETISRCILEKLSFADAPNPKRLNKQEARAELTAILHRMIDVFTKDNEAEKWLMLILREQVSPGAAFDTLYDNAFSKVQSHLSQLVARVCGTKPSSHQVIVQTHMLAGQVAFLLVGRTPLLRRLAKRESQLDAATIAIAKNTIALNINALDA
ncbi:CerR family C-terminal domain-containing protein [Gilvimarinus sp. DA14]|uniref:CerR family C-terminal domain-containing protein n=1 Tax=Gilvimarinus sp. DA14 TaxID=2956798 RepID=UPI0020B8A036|nr:CerR family C-terminal domain-containing protein [Gilvimarinus sp. DA14]UTF59776.1 CerR family C-terminal domain-containing protein [Gilvimarinus sp. DA14]